LTLLFREKDQKSSNGVIELRKEDLFSQSQRVFEKPGKITSFRVWVKYQTTRLLAFFFSFSLFTFKKLLKQVDFCILEFQKETMNISSLLGTQNVKNGRNKKKIVVSFINLYFVHYSHKVFFKK